MIEAAREKIREWLALADKGDTAVLLNRPWPKASAHQRIAAEVLRAVLDLHLPAGRKGPSQGAQNLALTSITDPD